MTQAPAPPATAPAPPAPPALTGNGEGGRPGGEFCATWQSLIGPWALALGTMMAITMLSPGDYPLVYVTPITSLVFGATVFYIAFRVGFLSGFAAALILSAVAFGLVRVGPLAF